MDPMDIRRSPNTSTVVAPEDRIEEDGYEGLTLPTFDLPRPDTLRSMVLSTPTRKPPRMALSLVTPADPMDPLQATEVERMQKVATDGSDRMILQLASVVMTQEADILASENEDVLNGFAEVLEYLRLYQQFTLQRSNA